MASSSPLHNWLLSCFSILHAWHVQSFFLQFLCTTQLGTNASGAGRRAVLEVEDGEVLPQREFVQYDREAEELDAHGVRIIAASCTGSVTVPAC